MKIFLLNLYFNINIIEIDKIKINLIDSNEKNIETTTTDPFPYINNI